MCHTPSAHWADGYVHLLHGIGFPEAVLRGLVALGPMNLRRDNLTLELGLSLWMRQCGIAVEDASDVILALRNILIEVAGFDPRREPTPFVGRSPELDLVNLTGYLGGLLSQGVSCRSMLPGGRGRMGHADCERRR